MPLYEVFIPNDSNDGKGRKGQVRADSWTAALKTGLKKVGGNDVDTKSLMCDIKPDGRMDVTDPRSGRVFVIRDLDVAGASTPEITEVKGRGKVSARPVAEILGELFGETSKIYDNKSLKEAASFVLGLAQKAIPSESGSVLVSDINDDDLEFVAATGPKASEVMKFRVPMGQGIVGFAAQESVSLAVSDVEKDERFYKDISDKIGYPVSSLIVSAIERDGRTFGAIELINRGEGTSFSADDMAVLDFLAYELCSYLINTQQTGS